MAQQRSVQMYLKIACIEYSVLDDGIVVLYFDTD